MVESLQLSPGVWIVRYEHWQQLATDALDQIPLPAVRELPSGMRSPGWHLDAACVGLSDAIFFGEESLHKRPTLSLSNLRAAQGVCDGCVVARECLTHALTFPEQYGIWAGTSGNQREKMIRVMREKGLSVELVVNAWLEAG